jgi:hypothetical protein
MLNRTSDQPEFPDFYLPFGGKLSASNKWVKRAAMVPWEEVEKVYARSFKRNGRSGLSARVAFGSLIVQAMENLTDRETVEMIEENPYVQYFLGFGEFQTKPPFDASMMVHFRKRFPKKEWDRLNEALVERARESSSDNDDDDRPKGNRGKLIIDATCAPGDLRHPSDLSLLDEARRKSEKIIDELYEQCRTQLGVKPKTYRRKAAKRAGQVLRQKKARVKKIRKECRYQLNALERNLNSIDKLKKLCPEGALSDRRRRELEILTEFFHQRESLIREGKTQVFDKIYSLVQPHVRAIYRGKGAAKYEFGAKISISVADGYAFLDKLSWDPYNECHDVVGQLLSYHRRFGCYPESLHADKIYHTRENRQLCSELGIRLSAVPLGRPGPDHPEKLRQLRQDERDRNVVEGKIGQCKRRFGLGRIMTKLKETSESCISAIFFAANLAKWEADLLLRLFSQLYGITKARCPIANATLVLRQIA